MSDSKVNKNLIKNRDIIKAHNAVEDLTQYDSNKNLSPSTKLLIEFLICIMTKDYRMALKYCIEILNREPNNLTALDFYPLILEKLEMTVENEEFEGTSSDSSSSSSSSISSASSTSSENNLHHNGNLEDKGRAFSQERSKHYSWHGGDKLVKKKDDSKAVTPTAPENETLNENAKAKESKLVLHSTIKSDFKSLQKEKLNKEITGNDTQLPSNLLIHPTQTITLISNNARNTGTRSSPRPKQPTETPEALQKPLSSKILLHTTRTITFSKKGPSRNLPTSENSQ